MTALVARQPLHPLSMSSSQRVPRRLSARLQEKEDAPRVENGYNPMATLKASNGAPLRKTQTSGPVGTKRKMDYDEEDDGFLFSRAKARKMRASTGRPAEAQQDLLPNNRSLSNADPTMQVPNQNGEPANSLKDRRKKMSFSTPNVRDDKKLRRSKRLSDEREPPNGSPQHKARRKEPGRAEDEEVDKGRVEEQIACQAKAPSSGPLTVRDDEQLATKIALPFADTPVIRRNKAMREGRAGKGERRSSLGLRGRRASSLIDTSTSNALPHNEVDITDFYKHIEGDGLPEPRRMRQLLTWCATRAMDEKLTGAEFEDQSARMAARVIQEELLKDFANRSEMSDWFAREDAPEAVVSLVKRPNPKNVQNAARIEELERQIKRLKSERASLESKSQPPSLPEIPHEPLSENPPLLSPEDQAIIEALKSGSNMSREVSARLNSLTTSLGSTIDAFADGIHQLGEYRTAAERVADRVLRACAEKLENRDREGRKRALGDERSKQTDAMAVLRSLSRLEP